MSNVTRYNSPIDELFRGFFVKPMDLPSDLPKQQIKMDVKDQEGAYLVHAEIPGARKEDIHVEIDGNQVSISSEVKQEKEVMDAVDHHLGAIARPRRVFFVTLLPKTRSGKLLRRSLQALAEGRDPGDLTTIEDPAALEQVRGALLG